MHKILVLGGLSCASLPLHFFIAFGIHEIHTKHPESHNGKSRGRGIYLKEKGERKEQVEWNPPQPPFEVIS